MEGVKLYYAVSTIDAFKGYTDSTILFSIKERPLTIYGSLEAAIQNLPTEPFSKEPLKTPLVLKFEVPFSFDKPTQLLLENLTQIGYLRYGDTDFLKIVEESLECLNWGKFSRLSHVTIDNIQTDISEKTKYIEEVKKYMKKMERYMESQTEFVDSLGVPDEEVMFLMGPEFLRVFGINTDSELIGKYGFTYNEVELLDKARSTFNELGKKLGAAYGEFTASRERSEIYLPNQESVSSFGDEIKRITSEAELRRRLLEGSGEGRTIEFVVRKDDIPAELLKIIRLLQSGGDL